MILDKDGFEIYLSIIRFTFGKIPGKHYRWISIYEELNGYSINSDIYSNYESFWKRIQELKITEIEQYGEQDEPIKLKL